VHGTQQRLGKAEGIERHGDLEGRPVARTWSASRRRDAGGERKARCQD
jgi:hypothetical protein